MRFGPMRCRSLVLPGVLVACLSTAALGQNPSAPHPVETVVVTAEAQGPAIWHATKNGADAAIMGIVEPLPDNFAWDKAPLEMLLAKTRLVLLPPQVRMGVFSGVWFYLTASDLLHPPSGRTLWQILDPHTAAELAAACAFLREPENRYSDNAPIFAAQRLGSDFRHVFDLTTHEPEDSIAALARAKGVRVHRIATYDLIPSGEDLLKLPPSVTGQCIDAAIRDIDFQRRHVQAAANAWAVGDTKGMLANWAPSNYYACLVRLSPQARTLDARSIEDTVSAIGDAISDGGRTVALVRIGILLRKDGVLDRLKAQGMTITGPTE